MSYIVPNATDTGSGQRYANINQAEPDSLDIQYLGVRANWVRSGCTASITSSLLSVSAGVVVINNKPYAVPALSNIAISSATDAKFVMVLARLNNAGTAVTFVTLEGEDSALNPTFPKSKSVLMSEGEYDSQIHINPDTDVLIGAIYVSGTTPITSANLVDKRVISNVPVTYLNAALPTSGSIDVVGDVAIYDGRVYTCMNGGSWMRMASYQDVQVAFPPIGAMLAWPGSVSPGVQYTPCDGRALSKSAYTELYDVIGGTYGETSTTFNVPNLNNGSTIFGGVDGAIGSAVGSNSATLVEGNLPRHTHGVAITNHPEQIHYTTTLTQGASGMDPVTTDSLKTWPGGTHHHQTQTHGHPGALVYRTYSSFNYPLNFSIDTALPTVNRMNVDALGTNEQNPTNPFGSEESDLVEYGNYLRFIEGSNPATLDSGDHTHDLVMLKHPPMAHSITETGFGSVTPTAVATQSKGISMRWFIRSA